MLVVEEGGADEFSIAVSWSHGVDAMEEVPMRSPLSFLGRAGSALWRKWRRPPSRSTSQFIVCFVVPFLLHIVD